MRKGPDNANPSNTKSREVVSAQLERIYYLNRDGIEAVVWEAVNHQLPELADPYLLDAGQKRQADRIMVAGLALRHGRLEVADKILSRLKSIQKAFEKVAGEFRQEVLYGEDKEKLRVAAALLIKLLEKKANPNLHPQAYPVPVLVSAIYAQEEALALALIHAGSDLNFKIPRDQIAARYIALKGRKHTFADLRDNEKALALATSEAIRARGFTVSEAEIVDRYLAWQGKEVSSIDDEYAAKKMAHLEALEFDYLCYAVQGRLYSVVDALIAKEMPISPSAIRIAIINSDVLMMVKLINAGGKLSDYPGAIKKAIVDENVFLLKGLLKAGALLTAEDMASVCDRNPKRSEIFHIFLKWNQNLSADHLKHALVLLIPRLREAEIKQFILAGVCTIEELPNLYREIKNKIRYNAIKKELEDREKLASVALKAMTGYILADGTLDLPVSLIRHATYQSPETVCKFIKNLCIVKENPQSEEENSSSEKEPPLDLDQLKLILHAFYQTDPVNRHVEIEAYLFIVQRLIIEFEENEIMKPLNHLIDLSPAALCKFLADIFSGEATSSNVSHLKLFSKAIYNATITSEKAKKEIFVLIGLKLLGEGNEIALLFLEAAQDDHSNQPEGAMLYATAYRRLLDFPNELGARHQSIADLKKSAEPWRLELADRKLRLLKAMLDDREWSQDPKAFYEKWIAPVEEKFLREKLSSYVGYVLEKQTEFSIGYREILMSRAQYFHDRGGKKTASYDCRLFNEAEEALVKTSRPSHKRNNSAPAAFNYSILK